MKGKKEIGKTIDCAVVGGGVIGCFAARELSRFRGDFCLFEAESDVASGTTKANSGIVHAGYDAKPHTQKSKYNVAGSLMMEKVCRELEVPYKRNGAMVIAFDADGREKLTALKARGIENGVQTEIISSDAARAKEPRLSDRVIAALYAKSSAIVSPYELAIACAENFIDNGGRVYTNTCVVGIARHERGYALTVRKDGKETTVVCRAVINAAGLYADEIHNAVAKPIAIRPRRGQYVLLDKSAMPVTHTVFQTPTALGKGVLVSPTCHGNTVIGPSAEDVSDKTALETTADVLDEVFRKAALSVPSINKRDIITQFSGLRAVCGDDFIIGESADGFFDAAGVCSPGLASSPAIGEYLATAVAKKLGLDENRAFDSHRAAIPCFATATDEERDRLIQSDPRYGHIVCRCETVTEAEIIEAVRRGARDLDGVKRRVRAGMGRCQAGFCTPAMVKILSRELGIPEELVTKRGGGSYMGI